MQTYPGTFVKNSADTKRKPWATLNEGPCKRLQTNKPGEQTALVSSRA